MMTVPPAAWRVTYTPGDWLVLSGPTMLVVMLPAPARMSSLVATLWEDIVAARSGDALLALFAEYGLNSMPDFAAFFWDGAGLHAMARGAVSVVDAETSEVVVSGSDVLTWREEVLDTHRLLRVDLQGEAPTESLQLPLMVGAVTASAIHLTTDPASLLRFPDLEDLSTDLDEAAPGSPLEQSTPIPAPVVPVPPHAQVVAPGNFQVGDDAESGTVFSPDLAATHKPALDGHEEQPQVLAVPCPRGHANPPRARTCRICSAPVNSSNPRLIPLPALAAVHSTTGEFANLDGPILVGRAPDGSKAPRGAHLMRVPSPSSDISRNHLTVTPRDWNIIVTDLDSTNGTTVAPVGEQPFVLANGESVQVGLGTVLDLGDGVSLRIEPPRG